MAKSNFDPEIRSAMQGKDSPAEMAADRRAGIRPNSPQDRRLDAVDTPAEEAQDRARGIKPNSPEDIRLDAMQAARQAAKKTPTPAATAAQVTSDAGLPPHHVAAAAGIAHAILGNRSINQPGG